MLALTTSINAVLSTFHLPPYYSPPRFHASVAWALLPPSLPKGEFPFVEEIGAELMRELEDEFGRDVRRESEWKVGQARMKSGGAVTVFGLGSSRDRNA